MRILLSGNIDIFEIEEAMAKYYVKSITSDKKPIVFDASGVTFISLWAASLMLTWIAKCRHSNKEPIIFQHPKKKSVREFLINYKWESIVESIGVTTKGFKYGDYDLSRYKNEFDSIMPFKYFHEKNSFSHFYNKLIKDDYYKNTFTTIRNVRFVSEGDLRNIFLRELGYNFVEHASSNYAHISMVKLPAERNLYFKNLRLAPPFMVSFYRNVKKKDLVEIVISDGGEGLINEKLIKAFNLENKKYDGDELSLIKYAFLYHTTTRTIEERMGKLLDIKLLGKKTNKLVEHGIATGLYYVKELARELKSFLIVRSGSTISYCDYYSKEIPTIKKLDPQKNEFNFTNFPGLQYRIIVPIIKEGLKPIYYFDFEQTKKEKLYSELPKVIRVCDYIKSNTISKTDEQDAGQAILEFENELLDELSIDINELKEPYILISFENLSISERLWQIIIATLLCIPIEKVNIPFFCINFPTNPQTNIAFKSIKMLRQSGYLRKTNPIVIFDTHFSPTIIGASSERERYLLNTLITHGKVNYNDDDAEILSFFSKLKYLTIFPPKKELRANVDSQILEKQYLTLLSNLLSSYIKNPNNQILFKNEYYLLLNRYYTKKYFDLNKLYESSYSDILKILIKEEINNYNPDIVITFGTMLGSFTSTAIKLNYTIKKAPTSIVIDTYSYLNEQKRNTERLKMYGVDKDAQTLIITDLICSGKTLEKNLIAYCSDLTIQKVFSLIDARKDNKYDEIEVQTDKNKTKQAVPFSYILQEPIERSEHYPPAPDAKIRRIDPKTGSIFQKTKGTIQQVDFFNEELLPTRSMLYGHFESDTAHFNYFLRMLPLIEKFGAKYAKDLLNIFDDQMDKWYYLRQEEKPNDIYLIYPDDSPGIRKLINQILIERPNWTIIQFDRYSTNDFYSQLSKKVMGKAAYLVVDTATSTGSTLSNVLDLICIYSYETASPSNVVVCSVVSRLNSNVTDKFRKIEQYHGQFVKVVFLRQFNLPAYDRHSCPICKKQREIERVLSSIINYKDLYGYLAQLLDLYDKIPVKFAVDPRFVFGTYASPASLRQSELRFLAEIAVADTSEKGIFFKKELKKIVNNFIDNPTLKSKRAFIALLSMIDNERFGLFIDDDVFEQFFYKDYFIILGRASKILITKIDSNDKFVKLVWPLSKIIGKTFWDHCAKYVELFSGEKNIIRHLFLESILYALDLGVFPIPKATIKRIKRFLREKGKEDSLEALVDIDKWAKSIYQYSKHDQTLIAHKRLLSNIKNSTPWRNMLVGDRPNWFDPHDIIWNEWIDYLENLNIMRDYKTLYNSKAGIIFSETNHEIDLDPASLRWMINNMDETIRSLKASTPDTKTKDKIEETLNNNWNKLRKLRQDLEHILEYRFTCSLSEQAKIVMQTFIKFNQGRFNVEFPKITFDTAIFGHRQYVSQIVYSIFENLLHAYPKASEGDFHYVKVKILRDELKTELRVYDKGLKYSGKSGEGFDNATKHCGRCLAEFKIPEKDKSDYEEKYTGATFITYKK